MTVNQTLFDSGVQHMHWLERYKTGTVRKIIALLNRAEDDLAAQIGARMATITNRGYDIGPEQTKRLSVLKDEIGASRVGLYKLVFDETRNELSEFAIYEADFQAGMMEKALAPMVKVDFTKPSLSQLRAVTTAQPFQGRLLKEWFEDLGQADGKRVKTAIQLGIVEGRTTDQIIRQIRGTRAKGYSDGILEASRRDVDSVVRTAIAHTADRSTTELMLANADIVKGEQWISTLDGRTTPTCQALDKKIFKVGKGPACPAHFRCRSRKIPYLGPTTTKGTRASANGQVPGDLNYNDWLKMQPPTVQEDILGVSKAKLFREGGMKVDQFVDARGNQYSLEQLRQRDGETFEDVFGPQAARTKAARLATEKQFKEYLGESQYEEYKEMAHDALSENSATRRNLSEAELVAVQAYTRDKHAPLNRALRSDEAQNISRVSAFASTLSAGLAKLPVFSGYVSRNTFLDADMIADMAAIGAYVDNGFMSTSVKGADFSGNVRFMVQSRSGRRIEGFSGFGKAETEVLFPAGTEFKILSIEEDAGVTVVRMIEK
ncbi:MAG: phage head morphosis, family domain protein [Micavibrio sp.]|nr:phage head morphosis, family domain protein [Micavibrio sp.]